MRAVAVLCVVAVALPIVAEQPRPMSAVDLLEVPLQREARLAPDGSALLVTRSEASWEDDSRVNRIWRVAADGTGLVQMTAGEDGESEPRWSPDGSRFAFLAKRGGETVQAFVQRVDGGEARQLTEHETSVSDIAWSPDGTTLYFVAEEAKTKEEKEREKRVGGAYSFDRDYRQEHLWAFDLAAGEERRVTGGDWSVLGYTLSADGRVAVLQAGPTPLFDDFDESEVWLLDLASGERRRLTENEVAESGGRLSPDGSHVLFVADADAAFEGYHQGNLFVVPAAGGHVRMLAPGYDGEVLEAWWTADGAVLFHGNDGVRTQLYRLEPAAGEISAVTAGDHSLVDVHPMPGVGLAYVASTAASPGDVWLVREGAPAERVTRFAEEVQARLRFPEVEVVTWSGADGAKVEGILFHPLERAEGQRVPLVVQTHGGPAASSTLRFSSWATYAPVLAAHGYAVLQPNYRGSTGYGDAFLRDMVGHYFAQADDDVIAGALAMVERGLADRERLITMGWSAGGHMTNWLVTQTDLFAAASSGAGAANWVSMYGQSDVRTYRTPWFLGTPWQADAPLALYMEHSPISHVARASTPTLILVGEKDVRVPMPQSVEMFRGLRANDVPTELVVFPGQPHGLGKLSHQLHKMNLELDWFARHALGEAYEMELPPEELGGGDGD